MATPAAFTANTTELSAANLNLFLHALKAGVKINYCAIQWADPNWEVMSTPDDNGEIVTGDLSWSTTGTDHLEITLSGFTATPIAFANGRGGTAYFTQAICSNATTCGVYFYGLDGSGVKETEHTSMVFDLLVIGV